MERLTDPCWKNLDPWECCGQDNLGLLQRRQSALRRFRKLRM